MGCRNESTCWGGFEELEVLSFTNEVVVSIFTKINGVIVFRTRQFYLKEGSWRHGKAGGER